MARLEDKISEQRERFERLQCHHDSVAGQLQAELDALARAHSDLQASSGQQLQQSKSDAASLSAQMLTLRRQHSDIHSMSSSAAADLAASRANESDLGEQLQAAHAERVGVARELSSLSAQFEDLQVAWLLYFTLQHGCGAAESRHCRANALRIVLDVATVMTVSLAWPSGS